MFVHFLIFFYSFLFLSFILFFLYFHFLLDYKDITFVDCSRESSSASTGPTGMALMHQATLHIEGAFQELELKMKGELDLTTKE